jgi:hypothetical protein
MSDFATTKEFDEIGNAESGGGSRILIVPTAQLNLSITSFRTRSKIADVHNTPICEPSIIKLSTQQGSVTLSTDAQDSTLSKKI